MKVAEARYIGRQRSHNRRAPSGESYTFHTYEDPELEDREWVGIERAEDARWLAEQTHIEVRWKPLGRLKAASGSAIEAMRDWKYRTKQKLVSELDLDVAGNASEEELEEELTEYIKQMQEDGEL